MSILMTSSYTISLNMIVKNESHIIFNTLDHLTSIFKFDYWLICDTGSTDETKKIITTFFKEKKIPGEIIDIEWNGFGKARTYALDCVYTKTDYVLIFDADDKLHGNFKKPLTLNKDKYLFKFNKRNTYYRPLILNNKIRWQFNGILHEYLENMDILEKGVEYVSDDFYIESGRNGFRNKNKNKYLDDASLLEKEIINNKKTLEKRLYNRYVYYCAQSYYDAGLLEKSLFYFKKVLELKNWIQEKYVACLTIGDIYKKQNMIYNALIYWEGSLQMDCTRLEGIERLITYYYFEKKHIDVLKIYKKYKNIKQIKTKNQYLLLDNQAYYNIRYFVCVSAYYVEELQEGFECCKKLILNDYEFDFKNIYYNMSYYFKSNINPRLDIELIKKITKKINDIIESDKKLAKVLWDYVKDVIMPHDYLLLSIKFKQYKVKIY